MTTTPDPLDALKYALTIVTTRLEGVDGLDDVIDVVEALAAPFTDGQRLDDLQYSDGSFVTVVSEYATGRSLAHHHLPPGYPTGQTAA